MYMQIKEFEFIDKYLSQNAGKRKNVLLGIGDDCALLNVPAGYELAVSTDSLLPAVHFPKDTSPYDIGYKALAANLSDLAAMGAEPAWASLALTLPKINKLWIENFCAGFFSLLNKYSMQLIGGDTTKGPLSITVQVFGFVPKGKALLRSGAKPQDLIYVTGTLGDAGWALDYLLQGKETKINKNDIDYLLQKLNRPQPKIKEGLALRDIASAAIDISDGLAADLGHILKSSNVGATIDVDNLPLSSALSNNTTKKIAQKLALSAGDDYELCFTIPPKNLVRLEKSAKQLNCRFTKIGVIEKQIGLRPKGITQTGYEHTWR